ncbi:hypothetical protein [Thalassoporum mexicanum]|uniref:hypothetical protein n=1 Tax=Thalassoporum mexicanum TaxID=3457544 RepID=UPI0018DE4C75
MRNLLYSQDLAATQAKIEQAGGKILKPIFAFPGGTALCLANGISRTRKSQSRSPRRSIRQAQGTGH